jgi:hypothetical protein
MKPEIEDKKLKELLKYAKLESPANDFSARVMNRIFEEKGALEQVKSSPVLGRGFWVILALFAGLLVIVAALSGTVVSTEDSLNLLQGVNTEAVKTGYQSVFEKIDTVPMSIAGILLASSFLLFLEKFLSNKSNVFS